MPLQHLGSGHHLAPAVLGELALQPSHELVRGHRIQLDAPVTADQKRDLVLVQAVLAQDLLARAGIGGGLVEQAHSTGLVQTQAEVEDSALPRSRAPGVVAQGPGDAGARAVEIMGDQHPHALLRHAVDQEPCRGHRGALGRHHGAVEPLRDAGRPQQGLEALLLDVEQGGEAVLGPQRRPQRLVDRDQVRGSRRRGSR